MQIGIADQKEDETGTQHMRGDGRPASVTRGSALSRADRRDWVRRAASTISREPVISDPIKKPRSYPSLHFPSFAADPDAQHVCDPSRRRKKTSS